MQRPNLICIRSSSQKVLGTRLVVAHCFLICGHVECELRRLNSNASLLSNLTAEVPRVARNLQQILSASAGQMVVLDNYRPNV